MRRCSTYMSSDGIGTLLGFYSVQGRRPIVDLALRLNVLAVCAAIVFVSAVLLGAF